MKQMISFRLPTELVEKLQRAAIHNRVTATLILERLIETTDLSDLPFSDKDTRAVLQLGGSVLWDRSKGG